MNYYGFPKFTQKSAKTKEKENRSFTGDPGVFMNHAITQKHYSYEAWLRIWNPELFLILTRGTSLGPLYGAEENTELAAQAAMASCQQHEAGLRREWACAHALPYASLRRCRKLQCSSTGAHGGWLSAWPFWSKEEPGQRQRE